MNNNFFKKGFTLIELLAVVLIISLLMAVAAPQYKRAMRRSEAMEAMVNLRSLFDSARRAKAATGMSGGDLRLQHLDIDFIDTAAMDSNTFTSGNFEYTFLNEGVSAKHADDGVGTYTLTFNYNYNGQKDVLTCTADDGYLWLCENLGENDTGDSGVYIIE